MPPTMTSKVCSMLLSVLLITCWALKGAEAGSCSFDPDTIPGTNVRTSFSQFTIQGGGLRAKPFSLGQSNAEALYVDLWANRMCETIRSPDDGDGRGCSSPGFPRWDNDREGTNVIRCVTMIDCNCTTTNSIGYPQPGVSEQQWMTNIDCTQLDYPTFQNLSLVMTFRIPNVTYQDTYPASEASLFNELKYEKHPNRLSLSVDIAGWPWHPNYIGPHVEANNSYVFVEFSIRPGPFIQPVQMSGLADGNGTYVLLETNEVKTEFFFDLGYVVDGVAHTPKTYGVATNETLVNPVPDDPTWRYPPLPVRKQFCTEIEYGYQTYTPVRKWDQVSYDPYFTSIFTGSTEVDSSAPTLTPTRKNSNKVALAASLGTVGGIIILVAIVAVLATTVPAFKALVRPFTKRDALQSSNTLSSEKNQEPSWSSGKKPVVQ